MKKTIVSNQVKLEILNICSAPTSQPENLYDSLELSILGYDEYDNWCRLLESRLQHIATEFNTGKEIPLGQISAATTVNECIQMVIN